MNTVTCFLCAIVVAATSVYGQEWTRFREPDGAGVSDAKTIPAQWTEKDINWRIELPGQGHSSPVLWGDKLFVTCCDEKTGTFYVLCFNALDGSKRWQKEFPLT